MSKARANKRTAHTPVVPEAAARKSVVIPQSAKVISARQVRDLLGGVSEMFLWRLLNERQSLKFPQPFQINKRNYFRRASVNAWIEAQERRAAKDTSSRAA